MTQPHFVFHPLTPSREYPRASSELARFGLTHKSTCLSVHQWRHLHEFYKAVGWAINRFSHRMLRDATKRHRERDRVKEIAASSSDLVLIDYIWESDDLEQDYWIVMSQGLCDMTSKALADGSLLTRAPSLHSAMREQAVEWRTCGGMAGMLVTC